MKLINNTTHKKLLLLLGVLLITLTLTDCLRATKVTTDAESMASNTANAEKKKKKSAAKSGTAPKYGNGSATIDPKTPLSVDGPTGPNHWILNDTIGNSTYRQLNKSFEIENLHDYKAIHRKWDWKILDKELDEIYQDMNYRMEVEHTPLAIRAFLNTFVIYFQKCDTTGDNTLDATEFATCVQNDGALRTMLLPNAKEASYANFTTADAGTGFYAILFNILDTHHNNYINFHGYMKLRLFAYAWKKCSVNAPFIEETNFECALDIASGYRTLARTTVRRLFKLGLELSNSNHIRNLDFMTYAMIASSVRLYGRINGKEDLDVTRRELNLALDNNMLPMRYNQDIIDQLLRLTSEYDRPNNGIDVNSFVFYDFFMTIFDRPLNNTDVEKGRPYYMNQTELETSLSHYLFPKSITVELNKVPQIILSNQSYAMRSYLNTSQYFAEDDNFLRAFVETDEKIMFENKNRFDGPVSGNSQIPAASNMRFLAKANKAVARDNILSYAHGNSNYTYTFANTSLSLFQILDSDMDGFLNFYDFGNLIQVAYLFNRFDVYHKGRLLAGDLYEKYGRYSDFPVVSHGVRERSRKFHLLPQDLYVDFRTTLIVERIDDIIRTFVRRTDKTTLFEYELKNVFSYTNMRWVPDTVLNTCLRGTNAENVPLYDWECAFIKGVQANLNFYESSYAYLESHKRNLTLVNTIFINPDPQLGPMGYETAAAR